jgi:1-acyl-sn-glycerol-3-phosphate acyltransferase
MIPPRFVRRPVLIPVMIALTVVVAACSPLLLLIGLIASRGRHRLLRVMVLGMTYLALETATLFIALWLWITGRRSEERYYALCGWFLQRLYDAATRVLGLAVEIQEPLNASSVRPVIVLSRHAGPGDSFLIVHYLINVYRRRPRIVMKAALLFDPALDVVLSRLPNAFVAGPTGPRGRSTGEIRRLATGLGSRDAMLIFPEGGNFTPRRRVRAIRSLLRQGRRAEARRARRMANVLPPHVAGTLAAIEAAPGADVIFVAHTGFDDLLSAGDLWRRIPVARPLRARWWRVPFEEIPETGRERWLYDWWETVDDWIADNRTETGS